MWKWIRRILILIIGLIFVSGVIGHIIAMSDKRPFDLVEIAPDRHLHAVCEGPADAPLVLYDAGAFGIYADGWWIKEELASDFRVCLYDRAGMGWSPAAPKGTVPSAEFHVEDMRRLVAAIGSDGPTYLIGHSMAGLRLHVWANRYPDELAGLIFVDAARPQSFVSEGELPSWLKLAGPVMTVGTLASRIGFTRAISPLIGDPLDLPKRQAHDKRRSVAAHSHMKATKAEILAVSASVDFYGDTTAETLPVSVYSTSRNGGWNGVTARASETNTGFGRLNPLPDETHVSLLSRPIAQMIATDLRDMHIFNEQRFDSE